MIIKAHSLLSNAIQVDQRFYKYIYTSQTWPRGQEYCSVDSKLPSFEKQA